MTQAIDDKAMDALFRTARAHNAWLDRPVADDTPGRIVFLRTAKAKERRSTRSYPGCSPTPPACATSSPATPTS
jgi:hypothetical protein